MTNKLFAYHSRILIASKCLKLLASRADPVASIVCETCEIHIDPCSIFISIKLLCLNTGWTKSHATEVKIEYLNYGLSKRADFFVDDRGIYKLYIHKDKVGENLSEVSLFAFTQKCSLSQIGKK